MNQNKYFEKKVQITGELGFKTAFHIGSGKEGDSSSKMGILKDQNDTPLLPGSSLKGCFRAYAEHLAGYLNLRACLLDKDLSGVPCVSDETIRKAVDEKIKGWKSEKSRFEEIYENTCDICKLFGSPMMASRIFFSDGELIEWSRGIQVRDGVCIDRDSETARPKALYNYEVAPKNTRFAITIDIENPNRNERALIAAVLSEWENGFRMGGLTSRGLGMVKLYNLAVKMVDYTDMTQLKPFLLERKMTEAGNLLSESLNQVLTGQGGQVDAEKTHQ